MTKKRILHKIRLTEISAVDRPCQVDARMTIMKRAEDVSLGDARVLELRKRVLSMRMKTSQLMQKFDEAQPRDEQGRWSSIAGTAGKVVGGAALALAGGAAGYAAGKYGGKGRILQNASEALRGVFGKRPAPPPFKYHVTTAAERLKELLARKKASVGMHMLPRHKKDLDVAIKEMQQKVRIQNTGLSKPLNWRGLGRATGKGINKSIEGKSAEEIIKEFVHSTNPRFKGKSKKERIKMALGAFHGMNKFDPNQDRDEDGKWSGGGDSPKEDSFSSDFFTVGTAASIVGTAAGWAASPYVAAIIKSSPMGKVASVAIGVIVEQIITHGIDVAAKRAVVSAASKLTGDGKDEVARESAIGLVKKLVTARESQLEKASGEHEDKILCALKLLLKELQGKDQRDVKKYFARAKEVLLNSRPFEKFDPNQDRDQKGRWASDGGRATANEAYHGKTGSEEKNTKFGQWSADGAFTPNREAKTYKKDYNKALQTIQMKVGLRQIGPLLIGGISTGVAANKVVHAAIDTAWPFIYRAAVTSKSPSVIMAAIIVGGLTKLIAPHVAGYKAAKWAFEKISGIMDESKRRLMPARKDKAREIADTLAQARSMAAKEDLMKFSPDQKRDERGRWSDGGGAALPNLGDTLYATSTKAKASSEQQSMVRSIIDKIKEGWRAFSDLPETHPVLGTLAYLAVSVLPTFTYLAFSITRQRKAQAKAKARAYQEARAKAKYNGDAWKEYDQKYKAGGYGSYKPKKSVTTHETPAEAAVRVSHGLKAAKVLALYLRATNPGEKAAALQALKNMKVDVDKLTKLNKAISSPFDLLDQWITEAEAKLILEAFLQNLSAEDAQKIIDNADVLQGTMKKAA